MSDDINKECQRLYLDIKFVQDDLFHGILKDMCNQCFYAKEEDGGAAGEHEDGFYEKYKKLFHNKSWEAGEADQRTLASLRELRVLVEKTEKYREKEGLLSLAERRAMKALSDRLEDILDADRAKRTADRKDAGEEE